MKRIGVALGALCVLAQAASAEAADIEAGRAKADACAGCHGADGISVSGDIPNLAGQKIEYLETQLRAFRDGSRANPFMNAIAAQLSDTDIEDLAAFWNSLPGAPAGTAVSEMPPEIVRTRVAFPEGYRDSFTWYTTIDFPDRKQTRRYYANPTAVEAARDGRPMPHGAMFFVEAYSVKVDRGGKPMTGRDGFFARDELLFYTAMQMEEGWGETIPDLLRNGDWNYAVFAKDGTLRSGVNQAKCLACHKPLADDSYLFTLEQLTDKVGG